MFVCNSNTLEILQARALLFHLSISYKNGYIIYFFHLVVCFGLVSDMNVPVNIYGNVETVISPNHTIYLECID